MYVLFSSVRTTLLSHRFFFSSVRTITAIDPDMISKLRELKSDRKLQELNQRLAEAAAADAAAATAAAAGGGGEPDEEYEIGKDEDDEDGAGAPPPPPPPPPPAAVRHLGAVSGYKSIVGNQYRYGRG